MITARRVALLVPLGWLAVACAPPPTGYRITGPVSVDAGQHVVYSSVTPCPLKAPDGEAIANPGATSYMSGDGWFAFGNGGSIDPTQPDGSWSQTIIVPPEATGSAVVTAGCYGFTADGRYWTLATYAEYQVVIK